MGVFHFSNYCTSTILRWLNRAASSSWRVSYLSIRVDEYQSTSTRPHQWWVPRWIVNISSSSMFLVIPWYRAVRILIATRSSSRGMIVYQYQPLFYIRFLFHRFWYYSDSYKAPRHVQGWSQTCLAASLGKSVCSLRNTVVVFNLICMYRKP